MALIFIRHGQSVSETDAASQWKKAAEQPWNPPLSPVGQHEVRSLCSELEDHRKKYGLPPLKRIFSSPFLTCVETATSIANEVGLARVCVEPSLVQAFDEAFYRSWAVPGCCVANNPTEEVRPEALMNAGKLVPCDWSRHPHLAPASVDVSYEPVLRCCMLQHRWGAFEEPVGVMDRLYRFFNFVTHAYANETVLVSSHCGVLQAFLQRECPAFRMKSDGCCALYLNHTLSKNGFCWRALGLVAPGKAPVELNMALDSTDFGKTEADSKSDNADLDAERKQWSTEEALYMLQRMKNMTSDQKAQALVQDAWAQAQNSWLRAELRAEAKRKGQAVLSDEELLAQRQREYEEIERKSQLEEEIRRWAQTNAQRAADAEVRAESEKRERGKAQGQEGAERSPEEQAEQTPAAEETAKAEKEELVVRNVADGRPVKASSADGPEYAAEHAVDGHYQTRWLSKPEENQWLAVNLGKQFRIAKIVIHWEKWHYPESYLVQGGADGLNWMTLAVEQGAAGNVVTTMPAGTSARWLRIYAQVPALRPGFSIWHLKVYNCEGPRTPSDMLMDTEPVTVTVRTIAGDCVTLETKPGEPVASLSQRAAELLGWGTSIAKLAAGSEVLDMAAPVPTDRGELVAVREPRATRALSGSVDGTLLLCNVETGEALRTLRGHNAVVTCVAADFMHQRALSGSRDRTLRVWNLETGQVLMVFEAHEGHVNCVAADFTAKLALSGSDDKTLRLWDLNYCEEVRTMSQGGEVACVAVDFERSRALTGGQDGVLRLWDLDTGKALWEQQGHRGGGASCLAADFGRQQAVSGGDDKMLRLWDLERGRAGTILRGHTNFVRCVEADFALRRALSGGADATLRLWDLEREVLLLTIRTNAGWVWCLAVNFQEERALSGSARENSLRMWDLRSGEAVSAASPALGMQGVRCVVTNFS